MVRKKELQKEIEALCLTQLVLMVYCLRYKADDRGLVNEITSRMNEAKKKLERTAND